MSMMTAVKNFLREEDGATAIEYGLIAALISVAIVTFLSPIGDKLQNVFSFINVELGKANTGG